MSNVQLWRHKTHQPGTDYAIFGLVALIMGYDRQMERFNKAVKTYIRTGLKERVDQGIQRVKVLSSTRWAVKAIADDEDGWKQNPLDHLLATVGEPEAERIWEQAGQKCPQAFEFIAAVETMSDCPALGGSDTARAAIGTCVAGFCHQSNVLDAYERFENNPIIRGLAHGDEIDKATRSQNDRGVVSYLRKLGHANGYSWSNADGLFRNAQRWAAIWEEFDGRPVKALLASHPLFEGLGSKDISRASAPFNSVFGVFFAKGREPFPDFDPRPVGYIPANRRTALFR